MQYILPALLFISSLITASGALRILVCFAAPSKSHSILGHGVVDRLLEAGHEDQQVPNLKEINVLSISEVFQAEAEKSGMLKIKTITANGNFGDSIIFNIFTFILHKTLIEDPYVVKLLSDPKEKFDAVILEWFFSELHAGIANLFEAPLIWVSSTEPHWQALRLIDEIPNPAYTVDLFAAHSAPLSFYERVKQLLKLVKKFILLNFIQIPLESWVYNGIYPEIAAKRGLTMPSYSDVIYNGSIMFMNSHPSIGGAMKLPQNAINIAGYHIQEKVKPLPKDLQAIMDGAKNGVIYFSLGSNIQSDTMSEEMKQSLLKMFRKLDHTVIWKFESNMDNFAPNVHLVKWAPQTSILSHPNLKLFITHGGQLSITEAVHFGVPLVGIPVMAEQLLNMASVERKGFGIKVTLAEDMADELEAAVRKVLSDKSFNAKAKELSSIFHNRQMKPGDSLAYWVEYVVSTRGAQHLRSPALTVCLFQRLYLDLLVCLIVVSLLLQKVYKYVMNKRSKKSSKKNKKE